MKNQINHRAVQHIARCLKQIDSHFAHQDFYQQAIIGLDHLELKQRVSHIITALHRYLPAEFTQAAAILKQLPNVWQNNDPNSTISRFAAWPLIDYASVYGLSHPHIALDLLKTLTHLFSAEFAIRPFIIEHPDYCHSQFTLWLKHEDEHVRRLVSEGTRPRLPWGMQLKDFMYNPQANLPFLTALKEDESMYVRRSVANHLNDISKDNPEVVVNICQSWLGNASNNDKVHWIIKHATRSLVKAGDQKILNLLGYPSHTQLAPIKLTLPKEKLHLGDSLEFQFELGSTSNKAQNIVVDFAIHFVKAKGQRQAKVFKLRSLTLAPNTTISLQKRHNIKPISTRRYYAGTHMLEILINGQSLASKEFELKV
ncbi:hypothetical protein [Flavobacterium sp. W21_SRS_FM6]|uniref:hypothetical protein n=1 Tax=Flavobacterium sp. W21_SRS_FM6 TaxID=3240268 RepID=UPI003F926C42